MAKEVISISNKSKKPKEKKKIQKDVAKVLNKNTLLSKNLLLHNPYLQSLLDPFGVQGAKIPDAVLYPSATFSIVDRRTTTVNAQGVAFGVYGLAAQTSQVSWGSLIPVDMTAQGVISRAYVVGMLTGASSTPTDLFPVSGGPQYLTFDQWNSSTNTVGSAFEKTRLVSCGMALTYLGAPLNAKGKITLAFAPRGFIRAIASSATSVDRISKIPGAIVVPVNELKGGTTIYKPMDLESLRYVDGDITYDPTTEEEWEVQLPHVMGGELFAIVDGATVGDSIQITSVFNYEGLPKLNTFNLVSASPSLSDPISLANAMNVTTQSPSVFPTSYPSFEMKASGGGFYSGQAKLPASQGTAMTVVPGIPSIHPITKTGNSSSGLQKFISGTTGIVKEGKKLWDEISPIASAIIDGIGLFASLF